MPHCPLATEPVVQSLLDTDLYKFTKWQPMLRRRTGLPAQPRFMRGDFVDFLRIFHVQRNFIRAGIDGDAWRSRRTGRRCT